jgi:O-antigen ligase
MIFDRRIVVGIIFYLGFLLSFLGIFFSPFLASLSVALFGIGIIAQYKKASEIPKIWLFWCSLPLLLTITDFLRYGFTTTANHKATLALGFATMSIAFFIFFRENKKGFLHTLVGLTIIVLSINVISIVQYFQHKSEIDALLLQSKSIPIFGGMHHIHFGIINALTLLGLFRLITFHNLPKKYNIILVLTASIILSCFHILSSRTGLLSFYLAIFLSIFLYFTTKKQWKKMIIGGSIILILPVIFYSLSSSLQNKFTNTLNDIETWNSENKDDINHQSMAMRLEAYKAALYVLKNNWFFGVGADKMEKKLAVAFEEIETPLTLENRKMPHNQVLESGVKYGIFGIAGILFLFLFPLIQSLKKHSYTYIFAVVLCLFTSSIFESILERQVSIFFTVFFIVGGLSLDSKKKEFV